MIENLKEKRESFPNEQNIIKIIIGNAVYNITEFIKEHPGGESIILNAIDNCKVIIDGIHDITKDFNEIGHSEEALLSLQKFKIKDLQKSIRVQRCHH